MNFIEAIGYKWAENKFVCVGLDPVWGKLPKHLTADSEKEGDPEVIFQFCKGIVDATKDIVNSYKPDTAFYEAYGVDGMVALERVCEYIRATTDVPIILDFKRGDIGNTNLGSARFAFDVLGVDAVTVQPYLGKVAMQAFLDYKDKGIIVLCKTSNEGSDEVQSQSLAVDGAKLYEYVAKQISGTWNTNANCLLVVGATYPQELAHVRAIVGAMPILVPGIGAQGGDLEATLRAGLVAASLDGIIINSSRGIIYASDGKNFAEAARAETLKLSDEIHVIRKAMSIAV